MCTRVVANLLDLSKSSRRSFALCLQCVNAHLSSYPTRININMLLCEVIDTPHSLLFTSYMINCVDLRATWWLSVHRFSWIDRAALVVAVGLVLNTHLEAELSGDSACQLAASVGRSISLSARRGGPSGALSRSSFCVFCGCSLFCVQLQKVQLGPVSPNFAALMAKGPKTAV